MGDGKDKKFNNIAFLSIFSVFFQSTSSQSRSFFMFNLCLLCSQQYFYVLWLLSFSVLLFCLSLSFTSFSFFLFTSSIPFTFYISPFILPVSFFDFYPFPSPYFVNLYLYLFVLSCCFVISMCPFSFFVSLFQSNFFSVFK